MRTSQGNHDRATGASKALDNRTDLSFAEGTGAFGTSQYAGFPRTVAIGNGHWLTAVCGQFKLAVPSASRTRIRLGMHRGAIVERGDGIV